MDCVATRATGLDRKMIRAILTGKKVKVSTLARVVSGPIASTEGGGLRANGGGMAEWPEERQVSASGHNHQQLSFKSATLRASGPETWVNTMYRLIRVILLGRTVSRL